MLQNMNMGLNNITWRRRPRHLASGRAPRGRAARTEHIGWSGSPAMVWNEPPPAVEVWFVVDIQDTCGSASIAGSFNAWNQVAMAPKPGTNSTFTFSARVQPNVGIRYKFIRCPGTNASAWEQFDPVTEDCSDDSCYAYGLVSTSTGNRVSTTRFLGIASERHIGWSGQTPVLFNHPALSTDVTFSVTAADASCGVVALAGTFNEWGRTPMVSDAAGTYSVTIPLPPGRPVDYMFVACPNTNETVWEDFTDVETGCSGIPGTQGYACFGGGLLSYTIGGIVSTTRTLYYAAGNIQLESLVLPVDQFSTPSVDVRLALSVDIASDCGSAQYVGPTSHWEPINMTLTAGTTYSVDIMARVGIPVAYAFMRCDGEWEVRDGPRELEIGTADVIATATPNWGHDGAGR
eukprot:COSAG02_NODE_9290_length_2265_cov_1.508772_3_plen_404_part_00